MRLLFAGGGTAGHINPALAMANDFVKNHPDTKVEFVGTEQGLEKELIPHSGYKLNFIKVSGFDRSLTLKNVKNICSLPGAVYSAGRIIKRFKPDVVIGTGGYVCGPVLYAAAKKGIPTLIHESNAFPGITTRLLSGYVDSVAIGVDGAEKYLPKAKNLMLTGTPLRKSLLEISYREARKKLGLNDLPFVVFFGGSLGARDFNKTIAEWICNYGADSKLNILMGTGKNNQYETVMNCLKENNIDISQLSNIDICEYIYDMDVVMNGADLVVSRAGASTLCELTALGKPAVLVPSPYVTGNHQEHNARAVEKGGGAKVILEKDFTPEVLQKTVEELMRGDTLKNMGDASRRQGHIDALEVLCGEIERLARE